MRQIIYLLDDLETGRAQVREAIEGIKQGNFSIQEFECPNQLLSGLKVSNPDFLILSLELKGASGLEVLHSVAPNGETDFPIVTVCSSDYDAQEHTSLAAGAHDHLLKERLSSPLLAKVLRCAHDSHQLERKLRSSQRALEAVTGELRRKDQAKNQFVASLSHELRTPVTSMMGLLSLLGSTRLDGEQESLVKSLTNCCSSLLLSVDDVVDMSRIEDGELEAKRLPFHLRAHLESALDPLRLHALDKNLDLVLRIEAGVPDFVIGDPGRLRQILSSLVSNGIKYTHDGAVTITIKTHISGVLFEVQDTGIGIDQHQIERLFEPYFQADSRDSSDLGRGLGLAIAAGIVDSLDGQIGAESRLKVGSKFWFTLPIVGGGSTSVGSGFPGIPRVLKTLKLLVAEDNPIVSKVLKVQLEELGHQVFLVGDGHEAVAACASHPFDVIVMDCQMPHLDGYDATRAIRKLKRFQTTPIIALTAQAFTGEREKCLDAGMSDYLVKPVTPCELQARFEAHLECRAAGSHEEANGSEYVRVGSYGEGHPKA